MAFDNKVNERREFERHGFERAIHCRGIASSGDKKHSYRR